MKNIVLFIVAVVLATLLFPIGILYSILKIMFTTGDNVFIRMAIAIDQVGNTVLEQLFNDVLIIEGGYRFGDVRETVSSALGKNKVRGTLTNLGKSLDWILEVFDENHSIKSINNLDD